MSANTDAFICHSYSSYKTQTLRRHLDLLRWDNISYNLSREVASLALIANIANIATHPASRFAGHARTNLINMLKKESRIVEEISVKFADEPSLIKITSLVKKNITPSAETRVCFILIYRLSKL
jgi:hypothetical protein